MGIIVRDNSQFKAAYSVCIALHGGDMPDIKEPFQTEDELVVYFDGERGMTLYTSLEDAREQGIELSDIEDLF